MFNIGVDPLRLGSCERFNNEQSVQLIVFVHHRDAGLGSKMYLPVSPFRNITCNDGLVLLLVWQYYWLPDSM